MRILISEKLSPHKYKTPEGYLICTDAVLARTGLQTYKRSELFACDDMREIEVNRTPEEVFSQATLASFENKPISIDHPDEEINVDNYGKYAVGFMRDIRRGKDNGQDVIIGDLVITDKTAIDLIESGEYTELSCGYDCDIKDEEHPCQRNIRGNHLALCRQGRAGNARIVDSIKDSEYHQIDMTDPWGGTRSLIVKAFSFEEAKKKAEKFKPEWKFRAAYQASKADVDSAKRRGLYVDSVDDARFWGQQYPYELWLTYPKTGRKFMAGAFKTHEEARQNTDRLRKEFTHNVDGIPNAEIRENFRDSVKDVNDLTKFKMALRNISKMYSNDPGIEYVTSTLKNLGYEVVIDSIDGWKENKNVPGEHIKQYRMNVMLEGREHHFLVQLYADMGEWKVKEINAYMLDSDNTKQGDSMKDEDFSKKTKQGFTVVEMYRDGGRLHAIVKRSSDYVVALGYDTSDGTWAQGRYVDKYENALATLKEEKPYARKIQDCDVTDSSDIYRSFNYMLNTYSMQKDMLYSIVGKIKSASDLTKEEKDMLIMKANSLISSLDRLGDSVKDETPSKEVTKNLEKEVKDSGTKVLKMGLIALKAMKSMKK